MAHTRDCSHQEDDADGAVTYRGLLLDDISNLGTRFSILKRKSSERYMGSDLQKNPGAKSAFED